MRLDHALSLLLLVSPVFAHGRTARAQVALESAKPWLGIGIEKGPHGVLINRVIADTPAAGAGLKISDEITAVDAVKVKTPEELIAAVQALGVGNTVQVHLQRGGKALALAIKLVARPDQLELVRKQLMAAKAPPFALKRIHGDEPASLDALKGKVVVVEFWATWCPACRSTHPRLSEFTKASKAAGIAVLAISDEEAAPLQAYAAKTKAAFTILSDEAHTTQAGYMVAAIPQIVVIDRSGQVAYVGIGAGEYLEEGLKKAEDLAKKRGPA